MMNEKCRYFDGSVSIITGGASGIGKALAEEIAKQGGTVIIADRQEGLANDAVKKINSLGGKAIFQALDVRDFMQVKHLVQQVAEQYGRLDFMFNNAGIVIGGPVRMYEIDDWHQTIDVNVKGVVHGVQAALSLMAEQGFGHIVNTASMAGLIPVPGNVSYCATKYSVVGLSKALRAEAVREGVRVSVLCPGAIRTPILKGCGEYGKSLYEIPDGLEEQLWEKLRPMDANVFAKKALKDISQNRMVIVHPFWWKGLWWIERISQTVSFKLAEINFHRVINTIIPLKKF